MRESERERERERERVRDRREGGRCKEERERRESERERRERETETETETERQKRGREMQRERERERERGRQRECVNSCASTGLQAVSLRPAPPVVIQIGSHKTYTEKPITTSVTKPCIPRTGPERPGPCVTKRPNTPNEEAWVSGHFSRPVDLK